MSALFAPYIQQLIHEMAGIVTRINEQGGEPTVDDLAEMAHLPVKIAYTRQVLPPELAGYVQQTEELMNAALQTSAKLAGGLTVDHNAGASTDRAGAHTGAQEAG